MNAIMKKKNLVYAMSFMEARLSYMANKFDGTLRATVVASVHIWTISAF